MFLGMASASPEGRRLVGSGMSRMSGRLTGILQGRSHHAVRAPCNDLQFKREATLNIIDGLRDVILGYILFKCLISRS